MCWPWPVNQVPVIDIGGGVAYPGFIDAHAHWIGDRDCYHMDSPAAAMDAAIRRGWTSISEQWVNGGGPPGAGSRTCVPDAQDERSAFAAGRPQPGSAVVDAP